MTPTDTVSSAYGKTTKTMAPSGRIFQIRESNGNDDDIIDNPVTSQDMSNIDNFLYGVVLGEMIKNKLEPIPFSAIESLNFQDRTHLLIAQRILTLGKEFKFKYNWGDEPAVKGGGQFTYVEDLSAYLHDYKKDFPKEGEEGYFKYKIPPYPTNSYEDFKITLSTGRELTFNCLNRKGEKFLLNLPDEQMTKNTDLKARNLKVKIGEEYTVVEQFGIFSKPEMVEIHRKVNDVDPVYHFITEVEHPNTKVKVRVGLLALSDFFFPREI